ncbi:MAG: carboxypeptidase-like regulatory domain-containing protein, partial [Oscillospiraceae bacterium]
LAQQDMIALRVVFRMGWALPNPASRIDGDRIGCPFAYLEPAVAAVTYPVKVMVQDNASAPKPVAGATVEMNGARGKSDAAGAVTFQLFPGSYSLKGKKDGYKTVTETIVVGAAALNKTLTLPAQG